MVDSKHWSGWDARAATFNRPQVYCIWKLSHNILVCVWCLVFFLHFLNSMYINIIYAFVLCQNKSAHSGHGQYYHTSFCIYFVNFSLLRELLNIVFFKMFNFVDKKFLRGNKDFCTFFKNIALFEISSADMFLFCLLMLLLMFR